MISSSIDFALKYTIRTSLNALFQSARLYMSCLASQDFENPSSVQRVLATVGMACCVIGLETRQSVKGLHLFKDENSFSHFGSLKVPWNLSSGFPLGMCPVYRPHPSLLFSCWLTSVLHSGVPAIFTNARWRSGNLSEYYI